MLQKYMGGWKQKVDCYNEVVVRPWAEGGVYKFEKARNSLPTLQEAT